MTPPSSISWTRAAAFASSAAYGPFLVAALYASAFVSCSHCKNAAWTLLPCGPGLLPLEAALRMFDLPRPGDAVTFVLAFPISILVITLLAWPIRQGRSLRITTCLLALALFSWLAFGLLAMIRS